MGKRHHQRARWHDYHSRCIYFITICKREGVGPFGRIVGDWDAPKESVRYPAVARSQIGKEIYKEIRRLPDIIPSGKLYQYVVMPDHIHFAVFVQEPTPLHLGYYISKFKNNIRQKLGFSVFEAGFNDQIISANGQLDAVFRYIKDNPFRLAVRIANAENFRRCDSIRLNGKLYSGYGNLFLLKNPFKAVVIVHRRYGEKEIEKYREHWIKISTSGGVLVSPFIAKREKEIRREAEELGGRVILILDRPLPPPPYKPYGRDFELCISGQLLILAPHEDLSDGRKESSRSACLKMNEIAEYIASRQFI